MVVWVIKFSIGDKKLNRFLTKSQHFLKKNFASSDTKIEVSLTKSVLQNPFYIVSNVQLGAMLIHKTQ